MPEPILLEGACHEACPYPHVWELFDFGRAEKRGAYATRDEAYAAAEACVEPVIFHAEPAA